MTSKEQLRLVILHELEILPTQSVSHRALRSFLVKFILPVLALFPEFSLGLHYLGKAFGTLIQIFNRHQVRTRCIAEQ